MILEVDLPLFPDAFYSYPVSLERVSYIIKYRYITRMERWVFDIYTRDNLPVILSQVMVYDYPITLDYNLPLNGLFRLIPLPDIDYENVKKYPRDIFKYFRFSYFYEA